MDIPLSKSDYFRGVAKEARIRMRNLYYEQNPILNPDNFAMIARPALRRWLYVGNGPIRAVYSQPGTFNDDLFVVSDDSWFRVSKNGAITLLQAGLQPTGSIEHAGTANIGVTPEFMFMTDGRNLYVYVENGFAKGTISGSPANNDVIQAGTTYYKFTSGSVNAGTPLGTLANPWLVAVGATVPLSWANLAAAFSADGVAGTQYSTALTVNPDIIVIAVSATLVTVRAVAIGAAGNAVVTTETGAGIAWTAGTLTGGGGPSVTTVQTPDDVGVISLGYIASYVVVVPAQGEGVNGQFYWIEPGETTIDPLDFATAERAPDPILQVRVFVDQFWLPGTNTTEVWYFTGNFDSPVARLQGVTFDRGTWEGTAVQVKESMIIVDADGGVFQIAGGLKRISRPDIEERIRVAIAQFEATIP
jgi:hypothetical protein